MLAIPGVAAPAAAPPMVGILFVDIVTPNVYVSVGTATSADWKQVLAAGTGQDYIRLKVVGTTDYVNFYAAANIDGSITIQPGA